MSNHNQPTDWAIVYKYYRVSEGSIIKARYIVERLIMRDEKINPHQARDFLEKIIVGIVEEEIHAQNKKIDQIRRMTQ